VDYETNRAEELARVLDKSPDTIRTEFQRVLSRMGLHDRGIAVTVALQRGWIRPRGSL